MVLIAMQKISANPAHVGIAAHGASNRRPKTAEQKRGQTLGGARAQTALGLIEIEGEVPALIFDDAFEHRSQQRMSSARDKSAIAGESRELVDRAPGHMNRGKMAR